MHFLFRPRFARARMHAFTTARRGPTYHRASQRLDTDQGRVMWIRTRCQQDALLIVSGHYCNAQGHAVQPTEQPEDSCGTIGCPHP
eukprot:6183900-Pleurochrysis_carterae.AAC.2